MSKVIEGRFREARLYLAHVVALVRPGVDVPTFTSQEMGSTEVATTDSEELLFIIGEAKDQLDKQRDSLAEIRSRAATLLTIAAGEVAVIASSAVLIASEGFMPLAGTVLAFALAVLAMCGAASILSSKVVLGAMDVRQIATLNTDVIRRTAVGYTRLIEPGLATVQARTTMLRDAVLLALLAAIVYAPLFFIFKSADGGNPAPQVPLIVCAPACPTSTTPSPSPRPTSNPATDLPSPAR